jgi:MFS family permease
MPYPLRNATEIDPLLDFGTAVATSSRRTFSPGADSQDAKQRTTKEDTEKDYDADTNKSHQADSLIDGSDKAEGSPYEKKCVLIDREIDAMGMGRYQWALWTLCGLGYLIDLMWAQAFGLILSPMQQELGFGTNQTGKLSTAFSVGLTAGAFVWGVLVDVIGRKWAFNLTVFIAAAFGLCIGVPDTYTPILVLAAFTGFGVGGNIPIDTTITLEYTPQSKRYLLPLLSVFQPIGVVICSVLAYGFIPNYSCSPNFSEGDEALPACSAVGAGEACCTKANNMGWRYLLYTLGILSVLIFVLRSIVFDFQESPKFLVYRGKDEKAIEVLQNVARYSKRTCSLTIEDLEAIDRELNSGYGGNSVEPPRKTWREKFQVEGRRFKLLFSDLQMTRLTLLVWLTYICDYWGFTVAGGSPSPKEQTLAVLNKLQAPSSHKSSP